MTINITYIPNTVELIFGTIDGETYGTDFIVRAEGLPDEDNVYPH